jgi:rare lipoprotein A
MSLDVTLRTPHAMAGALALGAALVLPAAAAADTASAGTGGTAAGGTPAAAIPAPAPVTGPAGHAITLSAAGRALVDRTLRLGGAVPRRFAGRTVLIQLSAGGGAWSTVASAAADRRGNFTAGWTSHRSGRFTLRAIVDRAGRKAGAATPPSGLARVTVYPSAIATWYGPRANRVMTTACGTQLTTTTIGVAHRSLPCGTRVELYYRGRAIVAPVIDRGPYANGADWDLTVAAADALGFTAAGVDRIGALRLG